MQPSSATTSTSAPRERPCAFTSENVEKVLAGHKTQTRRILKWKPREEGLNLGFSGLEVGFYNSANSASGWVLRSRDGGMRWNDRTYPLHCPYGVPGDRLWVREKFKVFAVARGRKPHQPFRGPLPSDGNGVGYVAFGEPANKLTGPWRPAIHMPRWASRLSLEVTAVRVERLQEISEADAKAEGAPVGEPVPATMTVTDLDGSTTRRPVTLHDFTARGAFCHSWEGIHGLGSWELNPWVFVIDFRRA